MNLYSTIWKCIIVIGLSIKEYFLQPASCLIFNGFGSLKAEPAPPFLLGSNVAVYCHLNKCDNRSDIFLMLQDKYIVRPSVKINCTTALFSLLNVRLSLTTVLCKCRCDGKLKNVNAMDLRGGYPPEKPEIKFCETTKSTESINCLWEKGRETHVPTAYNISIQRYDGTELLQDQINGGEEITFSWKKMGQNTKYQLNITAYNRFGASQSDPFLLCVNDIVIPETPHILHMEFLNDSIASLLRWETADSSKNLRACVQLRTGSNAWEDWVGTEPSKGLVRVEGLKPLTEYEFQMRTCFLTPGLSHTSTSCFTSESTFSKRQFCSRWSETVRGKSPGKGPSQQLEVWRILGHKGKMVTVLWKPPSLEDYSGEVKRYEMVVDNDHRQNETCAAVLSQCSSQVPAEVRRLRISAITSYGSSPPADVPIRHSGDFGPVWKELAPVDNGSAVLVSWSWKENHWHPSGGELLHYVLEWRSVPQEEMQWHKLDKDENETTITDLTAAVRYNISIYAVTTRGVSAPSSRLVYSQEKKPESGPSVSVLGHKSRQIQIQWDELPIDQQRGFIKHYTIYIQTLDSSYTELSFRLSGTSLRERWLDCPDGALTLQMTASTSAGEGPRGSRTYFKSAAPAVGLMIVWVFILTLFFGIVANLLCWRCVRERAKQKCVSWAPACIGENLPKPGNSFAIWLKHDNSEPSFPFICSDPPLSPVSLISQVERDNMYPAIHDEGGYKTKTPLPSSDQDVMSSYKPHISTLAPQGVEEMAMETEEEEKERGVPLCRLEDRTLSTFGGLKGGLLSSVQVDISFSPLTHSSVSDHWNETPEETNVLNGSFLLDRRETKHLEESPCLDLWQGEITICDTRLSEYRTEGILTGGYFPQVAAASRTSDSDTETVI